MKHARLMALVLIPLVAGCDVAVGVYFATRKKSSSSRSSSAPAPDVRFFIWGADLTGVTDSQEVTDTDTAGGNPGARWTLLGSGTSSMEFTVPPSTYNSVLIQATEAQVYHIDAIEVLDTTGTTTATATAGTLFTLPALVTNVNNIAGTPDAVVAQTVATATNKAFVFLHHTAFVEKFRVTLWQPTVRSEGDLEWVATYPLPSNQIAGGAAVTGTSGMTYLVLRDGNAHQLLRYSAAGAVVQDDFSPPRDLTPLGSVTSASGHASVVTDNDDVFIAVTELAGNIRLFKFLGNDDQHVWTFPAQSGPGVDRVEPNGLALNSNGDLILAGGFDQQGLVGVQHYVRKHSKADGSDMWLGSPPPAPPADATNTYWFAVAARGTTDVFLAGNQAQALGLGPVDIYTQRMLDSSPASVTETWNNVFNNGAQNPGLGRSVGFDAGGNVFVAGSLTSGNLNSVIVRFASGAPPPSLHLLSSRTGNDEFLDIAVEPDGTIYAVGYETNGTQGQDMVLLKIAPNNTVLWKRTVHGFGDDRAVTVFVSSVHVFVVGELGIAAGNRDIHVRKYVK